MAPVTAVGQGNRDRSDTAAAQLPPEYSRSLATSISNQHDCLSLLLVCWYLETRPPMSEFLAANPEVPGSIPGVTRFF
jgi:hypothetical protein